MRSAANLLCSQLLFARPKLYSVILNATFSKEILLWSRIINFSYVTKLSTLFISEADIPAAYFVEWRMLVCDHMPVYNYV